MTYLSESVGRHISLDLCQPDWTQRQVCLDSRDLGPLPLPSEARSRLPRPFVGGSALRPPRFEEPAAQWIEVPAHNRPVSDSSLPCADLLPAFVRTL
jgi:hypothetical protein